MTQDAHSQFVNGQKVTALHLQHMQDRLREGLADIRSSIGLGKVAWGLKADIEEDNIVLQPGAAFTLNGHRLSLDSIAQVPLPGENGPWELVLTGTNDDIEQLRHDGASTIINLTTLVSVRSVTDNDGASIVIATIEANEEGLVLQQDPELFAATGNHNHTGEWYQNSLGQWLFDGVPLVDNTEGPAIPGPKGDLGPVGPKGEQGEIGPQGPIGETGPAGEKGDKGDRGIQGERGLPGLKGETGTQGIAGETGAEGPIGPQGDEGEKGEKGIPGTVGLRGPIGPKGDTGPAGKAGSAGPKGDKGDAGPAGKAGAVGKTGSAGPKGDKGDTGPAGKAGAVGKAGSAGPKGDKGDTGPAGKAGALGKAGSAGPKGDKGDTGPAGKAGAVGKTGPTGKTGPIGPRGAAGPQGPIGKNGTTGKTGATGKTGPAGPRGIKGEPGLGLDRDWPSVAEISWPHDGRVSSSMATNLIRSINVSLSTRMSGTITEAQPQVIQVIFESAFNRRQIIMPMTYIQGICKLGRQNIEWRPQGDTGALLKRLTESGSRIFIRVHCGALIDENKRPFSASPDVLHNTNTPKTPGGILESWFTIAGNG